ncbi:MAG: sigma-70 family RNA polymerase sigma factor [Saprospiraceae bacterium]|nr:sigma-70 family RNA polymerase sigma factor [Saprospiraceae bacterium]
MENVELLRKLRSRNSKIYNQAYKEIYQKAYRVCTSFVLKNSGNENEAGDTFRDAVVILLQKVRKNLDFQLTSKIETLLYGITRNLWMKELQKRKRKKEFHVEEIPVKVEKAVSVDRFFETDVKDKEELGELLMHIMRTLDSFGKEDCRKIIQLFYLEQASLRTIAEEFGLTEKYAKKKKANCLKYLRKEILKDIQI